MSNFVVGVGGSGAKFTHSLLHLTAAGLLEGKSPELRALLVDPDENNGNVEECQRLASQYKDCKDRLALGATSLFNASFQVTGPWTPIARPDLDSLEKLFQYADLIARDDIDRDLLDLLFEPEERALPLKQGFRGRPAIGATVFANSVNFQHGAWKKLNEDIAALGNQRVRVMLAGSVFGGSGAAGVPTLVRLLHEQTKDKAKDLRLGLALFLPFFRFRPVEGEAVQADPAAFPMATSEALRYYYERHYLDICHSIYCVGEEIPAEMSVSAIGAKEQRNDAHFVELVAAAGALRFFAEQAGDDRQLFAAARERDNTLGWEDIPFEEALKTQMNGKLQQMAVFAVCYKYVIYPWIEKGLASGTTWPGWVTHVDKAKVQKDTMARAATALSTYIDSFLTWLLNVSTPNRQGFEPGLVTPQVFAESDGNRWKLKPVNKFNDNDLGRLLKRQAKAKLDAKAVWEGAGRAVNDPNADGPGRLIRAIYDACELN